VRRWIPPLIVTKEQMDGALTIIESALKHVFETV
jgi:acetylornithine/succinyldiaminopimelate/putrescine aminotransferase